MSWQDDLKTQRIAILCGSGISIPAGLPSGRDLVGAFLESYTVAGEARDQLRAAFDSPPDDMPQLRFEGILEVLRDCFDPELRVLDVLRGGVPATGHRILARLATHCPVLTTNHDTLIEQAAKDLSPNISQFYLDEHFGGTSDEAKGLWKLHGTFEALKDGELELLSSNDSGGPIVTLRSLSASRESEAKSGFVRRVIRQHCLVVVGYSGCDDFDIYRWILEAARSRELEGIVWVKHVDGRPELRVGEHCFHVDDRAVRRLAFALDSCSSINKLRVLEGSTLEVLAELPDAGDVGPASSAKGAPNVDYPLGTPWQRQVTTGALFSQLSDYRAALPYLQEAWALARPGREKALTGIFLARALGSVGDLKSHHNALQFARASSQEAVAFGCLHLHRRARFEEVNVRRWVDHDTPAAKRDLQALLSDTPRTDEDGKELRMEIGVTLWQIGRHLGSEPGADYQEEGGSLKAKGLDLHEKAREWWRRRETGKAESHLKEAIELRQDLGDVRGLCASLTVLGSLLRSQDVTDGAALDRAAEAYWRARHLATRHGLQWDELQATLGLITVAVRVGAEVERIERLFMELDRLRSTWNRADEVLVVFLRGLSELARRRPLQDAARDATPHFARVVSRFRNDDVRLREPATLARVNLLACRALVSGSDVVESNAWARATGELATPYWKHRVGQLEDLLRNGESRTPARMFLEPLGAPLQEAARC